MKTRHDIIYVNPTDFEKALAQMHYFFRIWSVGWEKRATYQYQVSLIRNNDIPIGIMYGASPDRIYKINIVNVPLTITNA